MSCCKETKIHQEEEVEIDLQIVCAEKEVGLVKMVIEDDNVNAYIEEGWVRARKKAAKLTIFDEKRE